MRRRIFIIVLIVTALMACASMTLASVPVYYADCITWTPAQPVVGQPVRFNVDPDFLASLGYTGGFSLQNLVLHYNDVYKEERYPDWVVVFESAGHYDAYVRARFGTFMPFDDDRFGPNPPGYVHDFLSDISFDVLPVPEPSAFLLLTCGLGAVLHGIVKHRRR